MRHLEKLNKYIIEKRLKKQSKLTVNSGVSNINVWLIVHIEATREEIKAWGNLKVCPDPRNKRLVMRVGQALSTSILVVPYNSCQTPQPVMSAMLDVLLSVIAIWIPICPDLRCR